LSKQVSELNVEEKASDSSSSKKREYKKKEGDGTITENAEGKDVKKQKMEKESMKTDKRILRLERRRTPRQDMKNGRKGGGDIEKESTRQTQGN
jgi:hypothetical protein